MQHEEAESHWVLKGKYDPAFNAGRLMYLAVLEEMDTSKATQDYIAQRRRELDFVAWLNGKYSKENK